ncbi:MAG: cupin domain-containing protein [candidate division Zixibacteria bacterium]
MYIKHIDEITKDEITGEGIANVCRQVPVGPEQGWSENTLRVFTLKKDGHTPKHSHDWEHVNYVISGKGTLEIDRVKHDLVRGAFAYVPPNTEHQYSNPNNDDFIMICIVPNRGNY